MPRNDQVVRQWLLLEKLERSKGASIEELAGSLPPELSRAGCMLDATARRAMIRAYESRLDQLVTHPLFEYRCSWRSMIRVHARLLARWLRGDVPRYESIVTR